MNVQIRRPPAVAKRGGPRSADRIGSPIAFENSPSISQQQEARRDTARENGKRSGIARLTGFETYKRVMRGQLIRLAHDRRWQLLPHDAVGRAFLRALLICGLPGPGARQFAPWVDAENLTALIAEADQAVWRHRDRLGDHVGDLAGVTYDERRRLQLSHLRPFDVNWDDVKRLRDAERNARRRKQRADRRSLIARCSDLSDRREQLDAIIDDAPLPVPDLIRDAASWGWRKPNGKPLSGESLARVIRRLLDGLKAEGRIEDEYRPGKRGAQVRWVRRTSNGSVIGFPSDMRTRTKRRGHGPEKRR